jgi:hypothetical protein
MRSYSVRLPSACLLWVAIAISLAAQAPAKTRVVGSVTGVVGDRVQLRTDSGALVDAHVTAGTRILRALPGRKDLASAPQISVSDIHAGDRLLVSGVSADAGSSIDATTLVVMSSADLAQRRSQEQQAWQNGKRGVVTAVDAASRKVTIRSAVGPSEISIAPAALVLRYRDGSSNFADAQSAGVNQIKVGDQLQAKGTAPLSAIGPFVADTVVFGTFANIAGRITAVDASSNAVTVNDLLSKRAVTLHLTPQSQLRQLPQMIAQRIAMAQRRANGESDGTSPSSAQSSHRPFDFQQVIARSPSIVIADLHKGDAIIAVAGSEVANSPAFYIVNGVEPILTASPSGSAAAALLASWNLSGGGGESE